MTKNMNKQAVPVSIMWKKDSEYPGRISVQSEKKLITSRGHFEESEEGVYRSGYVGSNSGLILRNRHGRDIA
jgi:hypothetical protein